MWKITNNKNTHILNRMDRMLVRPLLHCIVSSVEDGISIRRSRAFRELADTPKTVLGLALTKTVQKQSLENLIGNFTARATIAEAKHVRMAYYAQRAEIRTGRYGLPPTPIPVEIATAFSTYIYEHLFDHAKIWTALGVPGFDRETFHRNFLSENNNLHTCPYCDLDTITSNGNRIVEHFLPRSLFPLPSVDPRNLLTSCHSCNFAGSGKGVGIEQAATSPYFVQAGDFITFGFQDAQSAVTLRAVPRAFGVAAFIRLTHMDERYRTPTAFALIRARREALTESLRLASGSTTLTEDEALAYVTAINRGAPGSFALRAWVRSAYP